jgi:hypothetical protein|nr:MAG TPA: hypothetical protein [Caudovirales sp. ctNII2]
MRITAVGTRNNYTIEYITDESLLPEKVRLTSKEPPRTEFTRAWESAEEELTRYLNNFEAPDIDGERITAFIDRISVKYMQRQAIGYQIAGEIKIDNISFSMKSKDIVLNEKDKSLFNFHKRVHEIIEEAKKYALGKRNMKNLFDVEAEGDYTNVDKETGEVRPMLQARTLNPEIVKMIKGDGHGEQGH